METPRWPIVLYVELTRDAYAEAAAAIRQFVGQKVTRSDFGWRLAVGLLTGFTVAAVLFGIGALDPSSELRPPFYPGIVLFLPLVALLVLSYLARRLQSGRTRTNAPVLRRAVRPVLTMLIMASAVVLTVMFQRNVEARRQWLAAKAGAVSGGAAAAAPAPDWFGALAPHAVWLLVSAVVIATSVRNVRRQTARLWDLQPALRRRTRVEVGPGGVTFDNGLARRAYSWAGLIRVHETPNLLLLCPSEVTFETLPRRAFASPQEYETVKRLILSGVQPPESLPTGFPVLAASPAAPPPAQPPALPPASGG
jgi:hypothetical protein